jgi:hypothetical protein
VEDSIDHDLGNADLVEHCVRKTSEECAAHRWVHQLMGVRIATDRREAGVDSRKEAVSETGSLKGVPTVSVVNIQLGLRREAKPLHFRRLSLARTSAQDLAAEGLRA